MLSCCPRRAAADLLHAQEVKLSTTSAERDLNDSLAEIYSIVVTLEGLEKAYLKDSIAEADYTETCSRLLKQYRSNLANEAVARAFGDLDSFQRECEVRVLSGCIGLALLLTRCSDRVSQSNRTATHWHPRHGRTGPLTQDSPARRLCRRHPHRQRDRDLHHPARCHQNWPCRKGHAAPAPG